MPITVQDRFGMGLMTFRSSGVHIPCCHRSLGLLSMGNVGARDDQDHRRGVRICRLCLCDVRNRLPSAESAGSAGRPNHHEFDELTKRKTPLDKRGRFVIKMLGRKYAFPPIYRAWIEAFRLAT